MKPEPIEPGTAVVEGVVQRRQGRVGQWLAELGPGTFRADELYRAYVNETGDRELGRTAFGMVLNGYGLTPSRVRVKATGKQHRVWTKL